MPAIRKFLRIEKILFLANVITFSNLENTYDYTARDSPKITKKPGLRFSKSNIFGLEALIKKRPNQ